MRCTMIIFFVLCLYGTMHGQSQVQLPDVMKTISRQWMLDSNSCNGFRRSVASKIKSAKAESITKRFLLETLGRPNIVQRTYRGANMKRHEEYVYFIYKERCPEMGVEGTSIVFVFEEAEDTFVKVEEHDYCG